MTQNSFNGVSKPLRNPSTTIESPPIIGEVKSPPDGGVKENISKNRGMESLSLNHQVSTTSSKNDSTKGAPAT